MSLLKPEEYERLQGHLDHLKRSGDPGKEELARLFEFMMAELDASNSKPGAQTGSFEKPQPSSEKDGRDDLTRGVIFGAFLKVVRRALKTVLEEEQPNSND